MPLYAVETAAGELTRSTKADIAAEITDIHCQVDRRAGHVCQRGVPRIRRR
jgi:phenylpyruvate tautomerase PptA (4-oxalocrotonate tautomerase family)